MVERSRFATRQTSRVQLFGHRTERTYLCERLSGKSAATLNGLKRMGGCRPCAASAPVTSHRYRRSDTTHRVGRRGWRRETSRTGTADTISDAVNEFASFVHCVNPSLRVHMKSILTPPYWFLGAFFCLAIQSHAHTVWLESLNGQLVIRFAEPDGRYEKSPGHLDSLTAPAAFTIITNAPIAVPSPKSTNHFAMVGA